MLRPRPPVECRNPPGGRPRLAQARTGELLAESLRGQGAEVEQMTYPGVTHEFFGLGAVVSQAKEAVDMATAALRTAFAQAE